MNAPEPIDLWLSRLLRSQHDAALREPVPADLLHLIAETEPKR